MLRELGLKMPFHYFSGDFGFFNNWYMYTVKAEDNGLQMTYSTKLIDHTIVKQSINICKR